MPRKSIVLTRGKDETHFKPEYHQKRQTAYECQRCHGMSSSVAPFCQVCLLAVVLRP